MFCHKCGTETAEGAAFCQKCGTKVVYADADQQPMDIPVPDANGQQTGEAVMNTQQAPSNNTAKANGGLRKAASIGRVLMWGSLLLLFLSSLLSLRINPAILVLIATIGMILSLFGPKPLSLSTKIQAVIGVILIVVIIVTSVRSSGGRNDKYVQIVKEGTLDAYPQMTVGKAFDDFLDDPKWESGLSDNDVRFVNVKGGILYYDKEAEIVVQFIVNEESGSFQYNACEINGIPQNNLVFWGFLETIYNTGSVSTEIGTQSGSNLIGETQSFDDKLSENSSNDFISGESIIYSLDYRGYALAELLGSSREELDNIYGAPTGGTLVDGYLLYGGTEYHEYSYGEMYAIMSEETGTVAEITVTTDATKLNGDATDLSREEIKRLFGEPSYEYTDYDESGEEYGYVVEYILAEEGFYLSFWFPDMNAEAYDLTIGRYNES